MTTTIDWKQAAHAIAHSVRRYKYQNDIEMSNAGVKPSPILNEFNTELQALTAQVWALNSQEDNEKNLNHLIEDD